MKMNQNSFSECVERLLAAEVIDVLVAKPLFVDLSQPEYLEEINEYLFKMNRECVLCNDGNGFYCTYIDTERADIRKTIQRQFNEYVGKVEVVVHWIRLCRNLLEDAKPIEFGDTLTKGQLLIAVEQSQLATEQLKKLAQKINNRSTATDASGQLDSVLQYLVKERYLLLTGNDGGTNYVATAQWSLFYEQLDYISECEGIPIEGVDEVNQHQEELV